MLRDEERKERVRRLAKIADERWKLKGQQQSLKRLAVGSSDEAVKGNILNSCIDQAFQGEQNRDEKRDITVEDPAVMKNLPGQDPGSTFQPQEWSGKIGQRD